MDGVWWKTKRVDGFWWSTKTMDGVWGKPKRVDGFWWSTKNQWMVFGGSPRGLVWFGGGLKKKQVLSWRWNINIKYPDWGRYIVTARDIKGNHRAGKFVYIDWPGWAGRARRENPGCIVRPVVPGIDCDTTVPRAFAPSAIRYGYSPSKASAPA